MSVARLTGSLLARKGAAFPIGNAYANPLLDPIPVRREAHRPTRNAPPSTSRCRMAPELLTQLRILAARQGRPLRAVLEAAVATYLGANDEGCPCLRAGGGDPAAIEAAGGCCQAPR